MYNVNTDEFRYALTVADSVDGNTTTLHARHDVLMLHIRAHMLDNMKIVSVETLESAIRADAIARGVW